MSGAAASLEEATSILKVIGSVDVEGAPYIPLHNPVIRLMPHDDFPDGLPRA